MSLRRRKDTSQNGHPRTDVSAESTAREVDPGVRPSQAALTSIDYGFILSLVFGGCCT